MKVRSFFSGTLASIPGNPRPSAQVVCHASSAGSATNQSFAAKANPNGQSYSSYAAIYRRRVPARAAIGQVGGQRSKKVPTQAMKPEWGKRPQPSHF